ncbi:hypothetical protein H6P81_000698 [Aristolochia fimbriata]|uniref:Uncharacterized protein n=1 Tax=Aristolochia fimbriata TaxID=158543 RepID=A0AAV7F7G2_ARIFI|nr:hypothetical protein H6P81_000698 [Aristolochia fimbriata]
MGKFSGHPSTVSGSLPSLRGRDHVEAGGPAECIWREEPVPSDPNGLLASFCEVDRMDRVNRVDAEAEVV